MNSNVPNSLLAQSVLIDYTPENASKHTESKNIATFIEHLVGIHTLLDQLSDKVSNTPQTLEKFFESRIETKLNSMIAELDSIFETKLSEIKDHFNTECDEIHTRLNDIEDRIKSSENYIKTHVEDTIESFESLTCFIESETGSLSKEMIRHSNEVTTCYLEIEGIKTRWLPSVLKNISNITEKSKEETARLFTESLREYSNKLSKEMGMSRQCISNEIACYVRALEDASH